MGSSNNVFIKQEETDENQHEITPVLLSSPLDVGKASQQIHINSILITTTKISKKPSKRQKKSNSPSCIEKKRNHELLTDEQKRVNHIASEQKRRQNIRIGFEKLVDIVPTLGTGHRSEALILQKSVDHLKELIESKTLLKERARRLQLMLGEIPDEDSSADEMDYF